MHLFWLQTYPNKYVCTKGLCEQFVKFKGIILKDHSLDVPNIALANFNSQFSMYLMFKIGMLTRQNFLGWSVFKPNIFEQF